MVTEYVTTMGKVVSSKVGVGQSISTSVSGHSSSLKEMYYPDITYEYTVDNQTYQNNKFWKEKVQINLIDKINTLVSQYPVGAEILVHYNPQHPPDSYLQDLPEAGGGRVILVAIGISVVIMIGIVLFIIMAMQT